MDSDFAPVDFNGDSAKGLPIVVREAEPCDAGAVQRLYLDLVKDTNINVMPERLRQIKADPNNFLLVCEANEGIRATAFVTVCLDPMYGFQPYAVVENIVVESDCRGHGIGSKLLAGIEALCRQHQCTKIMLESNAVRTDAHRFFVRHGFNGDKKKGFVNYLNQPKPSK